MGPVRLRSWNRRSDIAANKHTNARVPSKNFCEIMFLKEDRHSVAEGVTFYEICPPDASQMPPQPHPPKCFSNASPDACQMPLRCLLNDSSWLLLVAPANFHQITTLNFLSKILHFCYSEIAFESICYQLPIWAAPVCSCLLLAAPGCSRLLLAAPGCSWLLLAAPGCSWLPR